jgi:phage terminase large subunit-like protein
MVMAGRGFGKTRTGAEQVRQWEREGRRWINLVGPTAASARDVMIEGQSGLLACYPPDKRPIYEPSKRLVMWPNGAQAHIFSAEEPDRLRGPQCEVAWCEEIATWPFQEAWDNLLFGLRLGDDPRAVITTTPKPVKLIREILADPHTVVTRGTTYENRANLAPAFFDAIIRKYEGTRLGRQELLAELLEDIPGALWTRGLIEQHRVELAQVPPLVRVVVAIDPAVTAEETSDETGIGAAGVAANGHVYVLEDASMRASPLQWARAACRLMLKWSADRVVAEVNNGGDLVEANIRNVHPAIPFRAVHASRGKAVRAEPVAALYERGYVHHVGRGLELLEDQLCSWVPGVTGQRSPDRLDWLVWAITDLVITPAEAGILVVDAHRQISPI